MSEVKIDVEALKGGIKKCMEAELYLSSFITEAEKALKKATLMSADSRARMEEKKNKKQHELSIIIERKKKLSDDLKNAGVDPSTIKPVTSLSFKTGIEE